MKLKEIRWATRGPREWSSGREMRRARPKPVIRRMWAPLGKRPFARFKWGYEWTYVYDCVRPESGQVY